MHFPRYYRGVAAAVEEEDNVCSRAVTMEEEAAVRAW
jgi:hypothetical protein